MYQQRKRERKSDHNDDTAHILLADSPRRARTCIAADNRSHGHEQGHGPIYELIMMRANALPGQSMRADENRNSHRIDQQPVEVLEAIHLMDIGEAHEAERGQHQDPDPGTEVAAIESHDELERQHAIPGQWNATG